MRDCKKHFQNTLIKKDKISLQELSRLTVYNILSSKGIIYTYYKNKKTKCTKLLNKNTN